MAKNRKNRRPDATKPKPSKKNPSEAREYETAFFAAEIGEVPTIDLHGMSAYLATNALDEFIHHELMQGTTVVKIIHGHGQGTLRDMVQAHLKHLKERGLVAAYRGANMMRLQNAVTLAALHRIDK